MKVALQESVCATGGDTKNDNSFCAILLRLLYYGSTLVLLEFIGSVSHVFIQ